MFVPLAIKVTRDLGEQWMPDWSIALHEEKIYLAWLLYLIADNKSIGNPTKQKL